MKGRTKSRIAATARLSPRNFLAWISTRARTPKAAAKPELAKAQKRGSAGQKPKKAQTSEITHKTKAAVASRLTRGGNAEARTGHCVPSVALSADASTADLQYGHTRMGRLLCDRDADTCTRISRSARLRKSPDRCSRGRSGRRSRLP